MLIGAITVASGASITLVASSRPPRPTSSSSTSAGCCANRQNAAAVSISKMVIGAPALARSQCSSAAAEFVVADEHAAAGAAEAKAFVDPHQIGRGIGVDAQARRFQDRAQIGDRRTLAVGAGDVDDRRQFAFGMIEPLQQPMHPLEAEIDPLRMQRRQPRDQFAERGVAVWRQARSRVRRGRRHFRQPIRSGPASATGGAGFGAVSSAGDLVSSRHSRASVGRSSWRCTTMSTMP